LELVTEGIRELWRDLDFGLDGMDMLMRWFGNREMFPDDGGGWMHGMGRRGEETSMARSSTTGYACTCG
jgi:hypothetical protein